jgi:GMP synthase (glutamine-hydrolysing)
VADARQGELPEGPWAGVVITGSAFSTYQDLPWIAPTEEFIRRQAAQGIPILGVCFGHQLLAQTFGGMVEKCPRGWELGTTSVQLNEAGAQDPLFQGLPTSFSVQQSHGDVVTALPPEATVLAANPHWGVQAFRIGPKIWGIQFHPEFTRQTTSAAIARVAPLVGEAGFPGHPTDQPLQDWLLSNLQDTPESQRCLANFTAITAGVSPTIK